MVLALPNFIKTEIKLCIKNIILKKKKNPDFQIYINTDNIEIFIITFLVFEIIEWQNKTTPNVRVRISIKFPYRLKKKSGREESAGFELFTKNANLII